MEAVRLATVSASQVAGRIHKLGLEVALCKTEVVCFHGPKRAPPSDTTVTIAGVNINVKASLKYLGIVLDSRWKFDEHFRTLAPKAMKCAGALSTLLPNLRGPSASSRSLYMDVVRSMVLYGAPVWHANMTPISSAIIRKIHRAMALRVIRGYCTVSYEAACLLAGSIPWELVARSQAALYEWRAERLARGRSISPREVERRKKVLHQEVSQVWREALDSPNASLRTIEAFTPVFAEWLGRQHGSLTFRMVQMLTGHGCFGRYLHQVAKREQTPQCHHCTAEVDTPCHTLAECPEWTAERSALKRVIGEDLSLPAIVRAIVEAERKWNAVVTFCETALAKKEEAEREREKATDAPMIRRTRTNRGYRRGGPRPP